MSLHQPLFLLVIAATAIDGLLAGQPRSVDQTVASAPSHRCDRLFGL